MVCEKKTPLEILQRNLSQLVVHGVGSRSTGESAAHQQGLVWAGDKFSCIITNVQERDVVIAKAHQNRSDMENLGVTEEGLQKQVEEILSEIGRLRNEIAGEEGKFARHRAINEESVPFGLVMREAIAYVIKKRLDGSTCLRLPESLDLSSRVFGQDHLMRLDRCEENLGKDTLSALRLLRLDRLGCSNGGASSQASEDDERRKFDPEALVQAVLDLKEELRRGLDARHQVVQAAHQARLLQLDRQVESWVNQLEDLRALQEQLSPLPQQAIQSYDAPPTWLDSVLFLFGGDKSQLRYLKSALDRVKAQVLRLVPDESSIPANFNLSNIARVVKWCSAQVARAERRFEQASKQSPVDTWNDQGSGVRDAWAAKYDAANDIILARIASSAVSSMVALDRFKVLLQTKVDRKEAMWAFEKELLPFSREQVSQWRQAADSIDNLVSSGLTQDPSFFAEFLDASRYDTSSWGDRVKLCVLAREVERKCSQLLASDFVLDKLCDCQARIQRLMQELFVTRSALNMKRAIARYEQVHAQKFEQFYNRSSKNIRANALREIVVKDLDLFTACFPVVFCTPDVASTLFKWRHAYFDLAIIDEASQSLPHNTFCALLKAKKVVVAGDSKQMPPTTLFNANTGNNVFDELEGGEGDDHITVNLWNGRNAANAESLLDYATDHSFSFQSLDLKFHYRSTHPDLMRFHAAAIYPSLSLVSPGPAADNIKQPAIVFTHVGKGVYKDQCNKPEARAVLAVLADMLEGPLFRDTDRSIAVATFNEVQKNEILRTIKNCSDPKLVQTLRRLQSKGCFFVKNLENLQGDEVDLLVVSTTFGPNARGTFDKRFGRITFGGIGYRYLNVLFSRAKLQVHVVSSVPKAEFRAPERVLDDTGTISGSSFLMGYLSYAQAVCDGDEKSMNSVLREFEHPATHSRMAAAAKDDRNAAISLEKVVYDNLCRKTQLDNISHQTNARSLVRGITVQLDTSRSLVIECSTYDSYRHLIYRKSILSKFGYEYYQVWPANWLDNPRLEFEKLKKIVNDVRRKHRAAAANAGNANRRMSGASQHPQQSQHRQRIGTRNQQGVNERTPPRPASSPSSSSEASKSTPQNHKKRSVSVLASKNCLDKPFLVRYGNKRKYIVFCPEGLARGKNDVYVGHVGRKKVKIAANRLQELKDGLDKDMFVDQIEFEKAKHYLGQSPDRLRPSKKRAKTTQNLDSDDDDDDEWEEEEEEEEGSSSL